MGSELKTILSHNGHEITSDADGLVSLTDIWRAAGADPSKKPILWVRWEPAKEFIASLANNLKVRESTLWKSRKGKGLGGTWAHWQIAMAYAKWLSPDFHQAVNEGFRRWHEEEKDPGLKIDRALDRWKQLGKEDEWAAIRIKGLMQRRSMCNTLSDHNCRPNGHCNPYVEITNTGNLAVIGKTAKEFKADKNLPASAVTRDHMEKHELAALCFFEAMTEKRIKDVAADGNDQCTAAAREVGVVVKTAMRQLSA